MPARVDTEHLAADIRRRVYEGKELLIGRSPPETVHIIVEHDRDRIVCVVGRDTARL